MGFSDFFNNSHEPKSLDILELLFKSASQFIDNNKNRRIVREGENGGKYFVMSEQTISEFLQYISKDVTKATDNFIKQNSSSTSNDSVRTSDIKKVLDQVSNDVKRIDNNIYDGITYAKGEKKYFLLPKISDKQNETLNAINLVLSQIQDVITKQEESIRDQSKIIENQHNSILRYENDVLFKSKKELLMELIGIADQIKYTLDDQNNSKNYDTLLEAVQSLGDWVNGSLQTETVRKYEKTKLDSSFLDTKVQEIIDVEETGNIEEDGKYKTVLPGYFWTMPMVGSSAMQNIQTTPRSFEFVLRPEQVVRMKYVSKKANTAEAFALAPTEGKVNEYKTDIQFKEDNNQPASATESKDSHITSTVENTMVEQKNMPVEQLLVSGAHHVNEGNNLNAGAISYQEVSEKGTVTGKKSSRKK